MEGEAGQQVGCTIPDSLKSLIVYGPQGVDETTDTQAATHRRGQYFQVEPVGTDFFDAIRQALYLNADEKRAVSIGTPWFHEWESPLGGIVSDFIFTGNEPWHNWKISGWKVIGGQPYLIGKSWQGSAYGDGGYHYVSREICNKMMVLAGTAAFTVRKATAADIQTVRLDILGTVLSYLRLLLANLLTQARETPREPPTASTTPDSTVLVPVTVTVPSTVPESVPGPSTAAMIPKWANLIAIGEGATPSSHNPGNLKYSSLTASWGATQGRAATDGGYLAQFPDDQTGENALCNFLTLGCEDELVAFHAPEARTLTGFTKIYAGNPPQPYIDRIVNGFGVSPDVDIATFLA